MPVTAGNVTPPDSRLHASKLSPSKVMRVKPNPSRPPPPPLPPGWKVLGGKIYPRMHLLWPKRILHLCWCVDKMWQYTLCWNITMSRCISFKLCFTFLQFSWQPETLSRQEGCLLANLATLRCNNCLIYKCQSFLSFIYFRHQLLQTLPHQKAVPRLPPNAVAQRWEFQIVQGFPNLNFNCQKKFSPTFWENWWGLHWFGAKSNLSQFMYFCVKQNLPQNLVRGANIM